MPFRLFIILITISVFAQPSIAQTDPCSVEYVVTSFEAAALSGETEAWLDGYQSSVCENSIMRGAQLLASSAERLEDLPTGTVSDVCTQNGLLASFTSAALSNTVQQWSTGYESRCESEVSRTIPALTSAVRVLRSEFRNELLITVGSDEEREIYITDIDGSNRRLVTNNYNYASFAHFSPDGSQIAFQAAPNGENWDIYVIGIDGDNPRRLTTGTAIDRYPVWSPDGSQILFRSERDGTSELYRMNPDGTDQTRITRNDVTEFGAQWAPDGETIIFYSDRDGDYEIFTMNVNGGSNWRQLTRNELFFDGYASYSPDGSQIVFVSRRTTESDTLSDIFVMDADGSNQRRITRSDAEFSNPIWSPDGLQIAITTNRFSADEEDYYVFIMNADGTSMLRVDRISESAFVSDWK